MNKKIAYILSSLVLFCLASPALAQTIPNFLGSGTFLDLLCKIAGGVGDVIAALGGVAIVVAAIFYLTSAGSPTMISRAKMALIYAIAGIVLGLGAKKFVEIVLNIIGASASTC